MRALVTFSFVLFMVISALYLVLASVATWYFWPLGIILFLLWGVVAFPFVGAFCVVWIEDKKPRFTPLDLYTEKRRYVSWNSIHGWPRGATLFYECLNCHKTLPSQPTGETTCPCGNLFIGPERIGAQSPAMVRLFEE